MCHRLFDQFSPFRSQRYVYLYNVARIGTASQGTAAAERSYQGASAYAIERLAMRSLSGVKSPWSG